MTPLEIANYYAGLLILQYLGLPKATGTVLANVTPFLMPQTSVQTITFLPVPTSGTFTLSYGGVSSPYINWNDPASTIQTDLQNIPALSSVTVSGSIADGLTVTFVGVIPIALMLTTATNNLEASSQSVAITIFEIDITLPIAVQGAFNIVSSLGPVASGIQLDIIAKYLGVLRTITTPTQTITLTDSEFIVVMQFAIVQNTNGSSLADIEKLMNIFFPGQFIIVDHKNMTMTYILSGSLGSTNLFQYIIQENLIPAPMGVGVNVFVPPIATNYFGFRTYITQNLSAKPFNSYTDFNTNWLFLSYQDALT